MERLRFLDMPGPRSHYKIGAQVPNPALWPARRSEYATGSTC